MALPKELSSLFSDWEITGEGMGEKGESSCTPMFLLDLRKRSISFLDKDWEIFRLVREKWEISLYYKGWNHIAFVIWEHRVGSKIGRVGCYDNDSGDVGGITWIKSEGSTYNLPSGSWYIFGNLDWIKKAMKKLNESWRNK